MLTLRTIASYLLPAAMLTVTAAPAGAQPALAAHSSLTIDQAVREALSGNLALAAQRYDIDIARAEALTARLRPNPELALAMENLERNGTYSDETEYAVGFEIDIEAPGKRRHRIREAEQALDVAEHEFQDAIRELVFDVQSASLDVLLARENLALAQANLERATATVELNEARYRAGDIDGLELRRTRLLALQAANAVNALEIDLDTAIREVNVLFGRTEPAFTIQDEFRAADEPPPLDGILASALVRRPDLKAAEAERQRAAADLRLQHAQRRPDVTVGTEVRRFRGVGNFVGLTASVPLPLFDRNQGEIARAQSQQLQADATLASLRSRIHIDIRNAHARLTFNRLLLERIAAERDDVAALLEVTERAYRGGGASLLEVMDARTAYNEASEAYNEVRADIARDLYYFDFLSAVTDHP